MRLPWDNLRLGLLTHHDSRESTLASPSRKSSSTVTPSKFAAPRTSSLHQRRLRAQALTVPHTPAMRRALRARYDARAAQSYATRPQATSTYPALAVTSASGVA